MIRLKELHPATLRPEWTLTKMFTDDRFTPVDQVDSQVSSEATARLLRFIEFGELNLGWSPAEHVARKDLTNVRYMNVYDSSQLCSEDRELIWALSYFLGIEKPAEIPWDLWGILTARKRRKELGQPQAKLVELDDRITNHFIYNSYDLIPAEIDRVEFYLVFEHRIRDRDPLHTTLVFRSREVLDRALEDYCGENRFHVKLGSRFGQPLGYPLKEHIKLYGPCEPPFGIYLGPASPEEFIESQADLPLYQLAVSIEEDGRLSSLASELFLWCALTETLVLLTAEMPPMYVYQYIDTDEIYDNRILLPGVGIVTDEDQLVSTSYERIWSSPEYEYHCK